MANTTNTSFSAYRVRFSPAPTRTPTSEYFPVQDELLTSSEEDESDEGGPLLPRPVSTRRHNRKRMLNALDAVTKPRKKKRAAVSVGEVGHGRWSWREVWTLGLKTLVTTALLVLLGVMFGVIFWMNEEGDVGDEDAGLLITAPNGAVSSDIDICSKIGVNLLKKGGNAVDAAIGTGICIGTINMFASGVGGGGFMVVRMNDSRANSFNFREMAPGNATRDMFNQDPLLAQIGGLAVGIPGEVSGYAAAHRLLGALPWKDLWEPSIDLNRNGFEVTAILELIISKEAKMFMENKEEWGFLFSPEGRLLSQGETMKREAYARTLEIIAGITDDGDESDPYRGVTEFYNGSLAERMAQVVQENGGIITKEDFGKYYTVVEETASTTFLDKTVDTCHAPCSGPVLLEGLNIAEGLNMSDSSRTVSYHYIVEAMKHLSAGRTELGDPFDPIVASNPRIAALQTKPYAAAILPNISATRTFSWQYYNPSFETVDPKGTSHLSVIDKHGNAVALTTTINLYWGAQFHDPQTGIIFNSEMDDFSIPGRSNAYELRPSIYNYILPYKRPLSSTSPTIISEDNGTISLVIGASGGSRIVTGVFQAVIKNLVWGWGLIDTVRSARLHHQLLPEAVFVEKGVEEWICDGLRRRGHVVEKNGLGAAAGASVIQVVRMVEGGVEGVADWWRKGGKAAGY
ncbi:hypothetical protein RUND412_003037 [Rhizina undulata]